MTASDRAMFTRPLVLSLLIASTLEIMNLIVFGLILGQADNLAASFLWSVGVGGIGMGAILGVMLDFIVIGQLEDSAAKQATLFLSTLLLGLVAKVATIYLGALNIHLGFSQTPVIYLLTGVATAIAGGYTLSYLLFTEKGKQLVVRLGL
ncbi:MAG: hypothetical protein H6999_07455 [Hahellaceae bacterium]|nr:hypothetical protein [Hahellaceae bacterium]